MEAQLVEEFLDKRNIFAVVGASTNPQKYGHKIYKDLREAGYEVYPVNPRAKEILGDRCYSDLADLPVDVDVVDIVLPPKLTEKIIKTCKKLGITKVWLQPGAESESAIEFCESNGIEVLHSVCVMLERKSRLKGEKYE